MTDVLHVCIAEGVGGGRMGMEKRKGEENCGGWREWGVER